MGSLPPPADSDQPPPALPPFLHDAWGPALAALGIPPAAPLWTISTLAPVPPGSPTALVEIRCPPHPTVQQPFPLPYPAEPHRWDGLHLELWAAEVPADWPDDPRREFGVTGPDGPHRLWLLRERAWRADSPLYAERTNYEDGTSAVIVGGWGTGWRDPDDPNDAVRAVRLLMGLAEGRSPVGRPGEDRDAARTRLLDVGRRACKRRKIYPEQLTHAIVAAELNRKAPPGGGGRISDLLDRAEWTMQDYKQELEAPSPEFS
jgi:hypothetical protein